MLRKFSAESTSSAFYRSVSLNSLGNRIGRILFITKNLFRIIAFVGNVVVTSLEIWRNSVPFVIVLMSKILFPVVFTRALRYIATRGYRPSVHNSF
jgi:hypothetical protein